LEVARSVDPTERSQDLRVVPSETTSGVVCYLTGNLESSTVGKFREAIAQVKLKQVVIFELESVPFIDSAGLGALIGAIRRVREMGGDAAVCAAKPSVARVLQIVGLSRVVNVFDTLDEAQAYFVDWTAP
jgi:anti-sigma B factor antagonist